MTEGPIWAFGVVLFEMLTGRVAFQGDDVSEILASVIKGDVKLDLLPFLSNLESVPLTEFPPPFPRNCITNRQLLLPTDSEQAVALKAANVNRILHLKSDGHARDQGALAL